MSPLGRSEESARRAGAAGLTRGDNLDDAEVILSVVPRSRGRAPSRVETLAAKARGSLASCLGLGGHQRMVNDPSGHHFELITGPYGADL